MARMIDSLPEWKGEAKAWSSIQQFLPDSVVVYNNREVNGKQFDFCLFFENRFILIIEVKGWKYGAFTVNGANSIQVDGYPESVQSPKQQSRLYRFSMLNKIRDKYGVSPLVMDMVCYPFISKTEYLHTRLDLCSEEAFTIFQEELEDKALFLKKLSTCYQAMKSIPHADFTPDLMLKLRRDWEPDLTIKSEDVPSTVQPYSVLSVFPDGIKLKTLKKVIAAYFDGIKQVLFVGDSDDYRDLADAFREAFKARNIEPAGGILKPGTANGLVIGDRCTRTFNLEIYYAEQLSDICETDLIMVEGPKNEDDEALLHKLGQVTSFNAKQYLVEHAPVDKNTMVQAGAGTGKTYTMVSRVAFLCNKLEYPVEDLLQEIALITFTNDAANNMRVRLKQMFVSYYVQTGQPRYLKFVDDIDRAQISTIHSFARAILRNASIYTGMGTNFKLTTDQHAREEIYNSYINAFIEKIEAERPNFINEIPVAVYDLRKKLMALAEKLLAKSVNLSEIQASSLGVAVDKNLPYFNELIMDVLIPAETQYLESLRLENGMDLRELIIQLGTVLNRMGTRKLDSLKYRYLFIDEFQDTDDEQIRIFCMLQKAMNAECRLFVVGDLKQSIYRFRGAKLSAFELLQKGSLGLWKHCELTINYRTDQRLLETYENIFERMAERGYLPYRSEQDRLTSKVETQTMGSVYECLPVHGKDKQSFSDSLAGVLFGCKEQLANAMRVKHLNQKERTIAVLVRSNYQVDNVVAIARDHGINMETKSGGDLFQLPPVQDLYKLMLALTNSASIVHLVNFIESNYTDLRPEYWKLHNVSKEKRLSSIVDVLDTFFLERMGMTWIQVVERAYTQPVLFVLKNIYDALQPWRQFSTKSDEQYFYTINYEYLLEEITRNARIEALTLDQVAEYLRINILTAQQKMGRDQVTEDEDIHFICTTVHKSKGLEYGTVVLPFTAENIGEAQKTKVDASFVDGKLAYFVTFANMLSERNSHFKLEDEITEQICDEMRILYVALTRAIGKCIWLKDVDKSPAISWQEFLEV